MKTEKRNLTPFDTAVHQAIDALGPHTISRRATGDLDEDSLHRIERWLYENEPELMEVEMPGNAETRAACRNDPKYVRVARASYAVRRAHKNRRAETEKDGPSQEMIAAMGEMIEASKAAKLGRHELEFICSCIPDIAEVAS